MERSYNGWPASPNLSTLNAATYEVATVPNRRFTTVKVAAPLFRYLIRRFHAEVDPLTGGVMDEWSYNYRKARAADALSCHASATAVDLDATQFPMGRQNMTDRQRAAVRRILGATKSQFRWGGDFRMPYTDEMHFELVKGTSPASVRKAISSMALHDDGRQVHPDDLQKDGSPTAIRLVKQALAKEGLYPRRVAYNGTWNDRVGQAFLAWKAKRPKDPTQARIDALGARTGLF